MFALLKEFTNQLKLSAITTGNTIFYIHNSLTSITVLGLSLLTTGLEKYGTTIKCIPDIDGEYVSDDPNNHHKYQDFFTTFCWMNSTYTLDGLHGDGRKYHRYYKWVAAGLFVQAVLFYIPKVIWDSVEGGLLRRLVKVLKTETEFKDCPADQKQKIVKALELELKRNKTYAINYWICETLCLVNVVVQLIFLNQLFDGEFLSYGWNVLTSWFNNGTHDYMEQIFPQVTMCTFYKEGKITRTHDSVCILPLNAVNEKTYLFMWFWLMALLGMLFSLIVYRAAIIIFPSVRPHILCYRNNLMCTDDAVAVSSKLGLRDWWIVYMLCHNIDRGTWRDLVKEWANTDKLDENVEQIACGGLDDPAISY